LPIRQCPRELVDNRTWEAIDCCVDADPPDGGRGWLPAAGGRYDQTVSFLQARRLVRAEIAELQEQDRQRKREP
jgi:hypothetical protein